MKLKLESFENMAILVATESVQAEDCRILLAGVARLAQLNRKWTLIDLSRAQLDSEAHSILVDSVNHDSTNDKDSNQLHWLGGPEEFCKFDSLEAILDEFNFKELRELSKKIDLQAQKETLEILIGARKRVRGLVEDSKREISSIECEYINLNRNLRVAQSQLINRLLDPVFSEFMRISVLASGEVEAIHAALQSNTDGTSAVLEAQVAETKMLPSASTQKGLAKSSAENRKHDGAVYNPHNLAQHIDKLQADLKTLKAEAAEKFIEGADRAVSLLMENDIIRGRIKEVRDVWLRQLEKDSDINRNDFVNGYEKFVLPQIESPKETGASAVHQLPSKKAV